MVTIEEGRKTSKRGNSSSSTTDLGFFVFLNQPMGANVSTVGLLQLLYGGEMVVVITCATPVVCTIK